MTKQWKVTKYGMESIKPAAPYVYDIEGISLLDRYHKPDLYGWPIHMTEKNWIDYGDFERVFRQAVFAHGHGPELDAAMLDATFAKAWRLIRRYSADKAWREAEQAATAAQNDHG